MGSPADEAPREPGSIGTWFGLVATLLVGGGVLVLCAAGIGVRSALFAFELHFVAMAVAVLLDKLIAPELRGPRFDVRAGEVRIFELLGVRVFQRFLNAIGWNRLLRDPRVFDGTRATLASYERATRHGENAHAWIFVVMLAPIGAALLRGWWDAALWIGSMSVLFHAYPVMLQRTMRVRLRELLARERR